MVYHILDKENREFSWNRYRSRIKDFRKCSRFLPFKDSIICARGKILGGVHESPREKEKAFVAHRGQNDVRSTFTFLCFYEFLPPLPSVNVTDRSSLHERYLKKKKRKKNKRKNYKKKKGFLIRKLNQEYKCTSKNTVI